MQTAQVIHTTLSDDEWSEAHHWMMDFSQALSFSKSATHRMFKIFNLYYSTPRHTHAEQTGQADHVDLKLVAFTCGMIASKLHDHQKFRPALVENVLGRFSHAEVGIGM